MKNFRLQITLRILLILSTAFVIFYLLFKTNYYITSTVLSLFVILFSIELISYLERTNRKITQFLEAIRYADFTSSFRQHGLGKSFDTLNKTFNEVLQAFNASRKETEEQRNYLKTIVEHVGIGLIVINAQGNIKLMNRWAKKNLKYPNIKHIHEFLPEHGSLKADLLQLKAGDKKLVKVFVGEVLLNLSLHGTQFRTSGEELMIISLQNITSELDENEMESWNKLIRVLTHEIMNSITPISTLASSSKNMITKDGVDNPVDLELALSTIENRSKGLLHFVKDYRSLTQIPLPKFEGFSVSFMLLRVKELLQKSRQHIDIKIDASKSSPEVLGDQNLIEQVIINLILNAQDAVENIQSPQIVLRYYLGEDNANIIEVEDNGRGVPKEIQGNIFIPFFTSKAKGSGIGLSISRQIMRRHKDDLQFLRKDGRTIFRLKF